MKNADQFNIPMPNGMDKQKILELLLEEEYGTLPEDFNFINATESFCDKSFCAGKAALLRLELLCEVSGKRFAFPVYYVRRNADKPSPCFLHINFRDNVPDRYQPTEEIIDSGYSVISFCYKDVTKDNDDFTDGLAGIVYPNGRRNSRQCGKIGLWACAAMRVMDHIQTLPEIDKDRISVIGHSRLGKTALLAGALDERFYCAISNDSGCSGAALSRGKRGERIKDICKTFPYWFSENYKKYADNEEAMPFDQHFLIAANAPHRVYVASAVEDLWADPESEYISCKLARSYFNDLGLTTCLTEEMPSVDGGISEGYIGYHIRSGSHYLSREDWRKVISFLDLS